LSRRARHWTSVNAARDEACLAVELRNRPHERRSFEGFVVHMHLAWLYLLQGEMARDKIDFRYWQGRRLVRVDGEPKCWDLAKSIEQRWPKASDPVRSNLEFFIGLRNKIEHRFFTHSPALAIATSGHAQALLLNFENELVDQFGSSQTLAATLRFPVFVGTFTAAGENTLRTLHARLPKDIRTFIGGYRSKLDPSVADDQRFEFRLKLIPELTPHASDALALEYIRLEDLSETAREALIALGRTGRVIVREQKRAVANLGLMKPGEAARRLQTRIPFVFKLQPHFLYAYRSLKVRPGSKDTHPERTREEFCIYDEVHHDYSYKPAYVAYLQRELSTEEGFLRIIGCAPQLKTDRALKIHAQ
jgi:Protein of unknown function (DUF3644)